jgi:autotransporter-associated beta strand protein
MDLGSEMVVNTIGDITLNGQLTGASTRVVTKTGSGLLNVTASNSTFSGTNKVSAGTLLVDTGASIASSTSIVDGGLLRVNGTAGDVTVNSAGSLGGSGTTGLVTLKSGSLLNPGNSPGTLTAAASIWEAGSTYNWEIDQASGGSAGTNWDVFSVTGALDLSALSSTAQMNLILQSLPAMDDYSTTTQYSWVFAQAGSLVGVGLADGADVTELFNINAAAFNSGVGPANGWRVEVGTSGSFTTLNLMAVPEPSTGSLMMFGLSGLVLTRLLRRKVS